MRPFVKLLPMLLVVVLAVGCGGSEESAADDGRPETLRLAVTDLVGLEELQRNFEPFRTELSNALGVDIELFPVADRVAAATALDSDRVDMVLTGPAEYVVMRARTDAVPVIGITRPGYYSIVATHADGDVRSLEDLRGRTIAMSDVGSTSGHLGPSVILQDGGVNPQSDLEVLMLGDGDLTAFENRETDAWGGAHLDFELFLEERGLSETDFRVLEEGRPLPNDIFLASPELSPEFVEEVRTQMLENQDPLIDAILQGEENDKYEGAELLPAEDSDYDYVREAYRAVGVDDYTEFVGE